MNTFEALIKRKSLAFLMLSCFLWASAPAQAEIVDEEPTGLEMVGDAIIGRPVMLGVTLVGTALFVVTLPFSALGGNVQEAANVLVLEPATNTFVRCLGCTQAGRKLHLEEE